MKTFSRISLFTIVCFGFALLLLGNTADVHAQQNGLEVAGITGLDTENPVGSTVTVTFTARKSGSGAGGVDLTITHSGLANVSVPNGGTVTTNPTGIARVRGTITDTDAWVKAEWRPALLEAQADFIPSTDPAPVLIVVKSPVLVDSPEMKIGATFTQDITIENRHSTKKTLPLSAWQMDVVFNPLILAIAKNEDGSPAIEFGDALGDGAHSIPPMVSLLGQGGVPGADAHSISPMASLCKISVSQSRAGLQPLGVEIEANSTKKLLTIKFEVLAVAEEPLGIHNVRLQSSRDFNTDGTRDRISYSILVSDVFVATHKSPVREDVNQDLKVDILDIVMVASNIGVVPHYPRADVNDDGFVNVLDLIAIYASPEWGQTKTAQEVNEKNDPALTAPSVSPNVDPATIQTWIDLARVEDDGSIVFDQGITNLQALLASRIPNKTRLLLNYPNPFNPETWIPYQLSEASDVTVTIHAMNGSLIRTLTLGHQAAGTYQSKSQAAYWDGRNELGEQVASGLYFYTLTAGNFSATGKMLVRK